MVLRVYTGDFVDDSERTVGCLTACGFDNLTANVNRTVLHRTFGATDTHELLGLFSSQPFSGNRATVFIRRKEEFIVVRFEETDVNVCAGAHKAAPRLHKTCGNKVVTAGIILQQSRGCRHAAHGVTGNTDFRFVDIIEIVEVFDGIVHTARRHHCIGITRILVVAVAFAVNGYYDKTATCKLDCILKLHFAVVEVSVSKHNRGKRVLHACLFGLEKYTADDFAVNNNFFFAVGGGDDFGSRVFRVAQIGDFNRPAVRLNGGRRKT